MSPADLHARAAQAGIASSYEDAWGQVQHVAPAVLQQLLQAMRGDAAAAPAATPVSRTGSDTPPGRAWRPGALQGDGRRWGLAVQLYALRSPRNWGMGDLTDLKHLLREAAALGAAAVGINPLHALFPRRPEHASPYSPSSRFFYNPLYLDVPAIEDFAASPALQEEVSRPAFQSRLAGARTAALVDYSAVAALKWPILRQCHQRFQQRCLAVAGHPRGDAFRRFQHDGGLALRRFALYNAIAELQQQDDWRRWPAALRRPGSDAAMELARWRADELEFFQYLQWQLALQLADVQAVARRASMSLGVYGDVAVGADAAGAEVWCTQAQWLPGVSIGAPPDLLNLRGQDWGLPAPDLLAMQADACAHYRELLQRNMAFAGALRVDHVLGLYRLWCIPGGNGPRDGAYVAYPWRQLFALLSQASQAHRCMVVGEDLGTVPREITQAMRQHAVLSYRLLYFMQRNGRFPAPTAFPAEALLAIGTHDLPPVAMWWRAKDIELRQQLGLWPSDELRRAALYERQQARRALLWRLDQQHLLDDARAPITSEPPLDAIFAYLAQTPCKLLMVQLADVVGASEQVNVPQTTDEHPNWRRKLPVTVAQALSTRRMQRLAELLQRHGRSDAGAAP